PEYDEHHTDDDAPAHLARASREEKGQEEHKKRRRPGQGGDYAHLSEAEGQQHQEDTGILHDTATDKIEYAASIAHQCPPVARDKDKSCSSDHGGGVVDRRIEERPGKAETEVASAGHHAKARRRKA